MLIGFFLILFCYATCYNWITRIRAQQENIAQRWELLIRITKERGELLPKFAKTVLAINPAAQPLSNELIYTYNQSSKTFDAQTLNDPTLVQAFENQQQSIATILHKMQLVLPPDKIQNADYEALNAELEKHDMQIQYVIHMINQEVLRYNQLIDQFPERIVNKITLFPPKYCPTIATLESGSIPDNMGHQG